MGSQTVACSLRVCLGSACRMMRGRRREGGRWRPGAAYPAEMHPRSSSASATSRANLMKFKGGLVKSCGLQLFEGWELSGVVVRVRYCFVQVGGLRP